MHYETAGSGTHNITRPSGSRSDAVNIARPNGPGFDAVINITRPSRPGSDAVVNIPRPNGLGSDAAINVSRPSGPGSDAVINKSRPSMIRGYNAADSVGTHGIKLATGSSVSTYIPGPSRHGNISEQSLSNIIDYRDQYSHHLRMCAIRNRGFDPSKDLER